MVDVILKHIPAAAAVALYIFIFAVWILMTAVISRKKLKSSVKKILEGLKTINVHDNSPIQEIFKKIDDLFIKYGNNFLKLTWDKFKWAYHKNIDTHTADPSCFYKLGLGDEKNTGIGSCFGNHVSLWSSVPFIQKLILAIGAAGAVADIIYTDANPAMYESQYLYAFSFAAAGLAYVIYLLVGAMGDVVNISTKKLLTALSEELEQITKPFNMKDKEKLKMESAKGLIDDEVFKKIEEFYINKVLPELRHTYSQALDKVLTPTLSKYYNIMNSMTSDIKQQQQEGMKILADEFIKNLYSGTEMNISALSGKLANFDFRIMELGSGLKDTSDNLVSGLSAYGEIADSIISATNVVMEAQRDFTAGMKGIKGTITDLLNVSGAMKEAADSYIVSSGEMAVIAKEIQEKSMEVITKSQNETADFANAVTKKLDLSVSSIIDNISQGVDKVMSGFNDNLTALGMHLAAVQKSGREFTDALFTQLNGIMSSSVSSFEENLRAVSENNEKYAQEVTEANKEILSEITGKTGKIVEDVSLVFKATFEKLTNDLSDNIISVLSSSTDIVEKMSTQSDEMNTQYNLYLTRIESNTGKFADEMEFKIENILARFTEVLNTVLDRMDLNISGSFERFHNDISDIMGNFDEQSRSMSLYMKELNIEITDLSSNLRDSVKEFNARINEGVNMTFSDFDKGLAEITRRLSDAAETINESVEMLPKSLAAISRLDKG